MTREDESNPISAQDPPEPLTLDSDDPAGAAAGSAPVLIETQRQRDEYLDLLLRKTAEFDNYRRRIDRERRDQAESAAADVLTDLLAIVDDFERALAAPVTDEGLESYKRGVELIHRQLMDLLRKRGVTPIEDEGLPFDPHRHQAVDFESTDARRDGEILGVYRRGYRLGDRLLRPAMVKVAKGE